MCGIYLRPLLQGAATFPLPPPMSCRSSRPPPAAPRHHQTPSRRTCGRLPDCLLIGCDCVRLWWNCPDWLNLCATLQKSLVLWVLSALRTQQNMNFDAFVLIWLRPWLVCPVRQRKSAPPQGRSVLYPDRTISHRRQCPVSVRRLPGWSAVHSIPERSCTDHEPR